CWREAGIFGIAFPRARTPVHRLRFILEKSSMGDKKTAPKSVIELLDRISEVAEESEEPSFEEVMHAVGRRSFGPLLLFVGVVTVAPGVGDIPGVPTVMGFFVLLVSVQLLFG